jgi:hypothetical protein
MQSSHAVIVGETLHEDLLIALKQTWAAHTQRYGSVRQQHRLATPAESSRDGRVLRFTQWVSLIAAQSREQFYTDAVGSPSTEAEARYSFRMSDFEQN